MSLQLIAHVSRGANHGQALTPHLHKDGMYVASMTRFKKDYVRVASVEELVILIAQGFRIREGVQNFV